MPALLTERSFQPILSLDDVLLSVGLVGCLDLLSVPRLHNPLASRPFSAASASEE